MENQEMNLNENIEETTIPTPPETYEQRVEEPIVQPINTPSATPVAPAPYIPAVHSVSPVDPKLQAKKSGKGLAVFAVILAIVLALSVGAGAGFMFGRNFDLNGGSAELPLPKVELEAKPENGQEYTIESIYGVVSQSVVRIAVYSKESTKYSYASGVIYSEDGYIITNDHIYEELPNPRFVIETYDGKQYEGKYIAGDTRSDLAVLKIEAKGLKPAVFGDSEKAVVGETVVAVGNPDGAEKSVATSGIVSAVNIWVSGTTNYSTRLIQTDAALNPGSSGGALANAYGQVIGITSSKIIATDTDLVNYAIPTSVAKRVADSLIKNGYVTGRAMLGITYSEINSIQGKLMDGPCGLYIQSITEDSGLYGKGLAKGDIITHVNGKEITSASVMLAALENIPSGETITIKVHTAKGQDIEIEAKLKEYIGSSSYMEKGENNDKEFDFPMGD